jgi:ribonucleoside-diphosphate reductase alpha chain
MNESLHSQPAYLKPAENSNKWFAPLGIGVTNLAHFMAKCGLKYGNPDDLSVVHEWMEATYYYALKASMNYAKNNPDRIPEKFNDISYSKGKFVFEDFAGMKNHPEICSDWSLKRDWDGLTYDINEFGLANSTVIAIMPAETSSIPQNLTNSIEPVAFEKGSTSGVMTFTPPDYELYADNYAVEFELSNEDYLKTASVCQRFNDQAISLNLRFKRDEDGMTDVNEIIETVLLARSLALKTIYYTKNRSHTDINAIEEFDDSGECESCKL